MPPENSPPPPPPAMSPMPPMPPMPPAQPVSPGPDVISSVPGLISAVPGISRTAPAPAPSAPLVDHVPDAVRADVVRAAAGRSVAGESPLPGDLAEDVESTRMVAERAAAEVLPVAGPSAVLRLWDGRRLTLAGTALMGRNPTPRDGEAAPTHRLTLDDPVRSVSKTHLEVGVDAQGVWVRDRASTNGTVVGWDGTRIPCPPYEQVRVPVGATVEFGRYWFTVG